MKKYIISFLLGLLSLVAGAEDSSDIVCGPWISDVSQSSFTVNWVTRGVTLSWLETGEDDGRVFYASPKEEYWQTVAGKKVTGTKHSVKVTGLKPGTKYIYRICGKPVEDQSNAYRIKYGGGVADRKTYTVTTFDASTDSCRFAIVNDIHGRDDLFSDLTGKITPDAIDFFMVNGDIVSYVNDIDDVTRRCVDPVQPLVGNVPYMYSRGNHEGRGHSAHKLDEIFTMRGEGWYYTFRQGPVAFIVLDAGEDKPDYVIEYSGLSMYDEYRNAELEWLKEAVKSPEVASAPVKICVMHIPAYKDMNTWYAQNWVSDNFVPVLNEAGVDLMLSGHIHKHRLVPAGESVASFPVLCNDNEEILFVESDGKTISVKAVGRDGALKKTYSF